MTKDLLVFVGTYTDPILFGTGKILQGKGEGIYVYRMNTSSGALDLLCKKTGVTNPSYLAFDPPQRRLYAVNELKEYEGEATGTVSAFDLDAATGRLTFLNKQPTQGTDPCHLIVDRTGKSILLANFMSGSVCVLPIRNDGSLGHATDFIQHEGSGIDPNRQQGPHAHAVTLDKANRYAFVPDLGIDRVVVYKFDSSEGRLEADELVQVNVKPGAGPRHIVFHPNGANAYLINELDSTITGFRYDPLQGTLAEVETVSTLPQDFKGASTCADIHIDPSGRFVYGSNRGHDSIVIFRVDPQNGKLSYIGHEPTRGKTPRNFAIDPGGAFLLVGNQDSDTIVTFRIDPHSGELRATGEPTHVPTPVCIKMMPLDRNPSTV